MDSIKSERQKYRLQSLLQLVSRNSDPLVLGQKEGVCGAGPSSSPLGQKTVTETWEESAISGSWNLCSTQKLAGASARLGAAP